MLGEKLGKRKQGRGCLACFSGKSLCGGSVLKKKSTLFDCVNRYFYVLWDMAMTENDCKRKILQCL